MTFAVSMLASVVLSLDTSTANAVACVECGQNGVGCIAQKAAQGPPISLPIQKFPDPNKDAYLFQYSVPTTNATGSSQRVIIYTGDVDNTNHQLYLANVRPYDGHQEDWPVPYTQRCVWKVQTAKLTRYYYLSYWDNCFSSWDVSDRIDMDAKVTVYRY